MQYSSKHHRKPLFLERVEEQESNRPRASEYEAMIHNTDMLLRQYRRGSERYQLIENISTLYGACEGGDERERETQIRMREALYHCYEEYLKEMHGEEGFRSMRGETLDRNVYASVFGEGPFSNYGYTITQEDCVVIREWRDEILEQAKAFQALVDDPEKSHPHGNVIRRTLGKNPRQSHVIQFSLAYFLIRKRSPWRSILTPIRALITRVYGGRRRVADFGKSLDFCADVILVAQILADELGFRAEVRNRTLSLQAAIRKGCHHYLVFGQDKEAEEGERAVFDPELFSRSAGYSKDIRRCEKEIDANGDKMLLCWEVNACQMSVGVVPCGLVFEMQTFLFLKRG